MTLEKYWDAMLKDNLSSIRFSKIMTKKRSKSMKGFAYERYFCKKLSLWWSENERDDIFWRTSNSGGRASRRSKQGLQTEGQFGDVTATSAIGIPLMRVVTIELKRGYAGTTIQDLIDKTSGKESQFSKWINQAQKSADDANSLYWLLVTRRNRRQAIIWFPWNRHFDTINNGYFYFKENLIGFMLFDDWFTESNLQRIKQLISNEGLMT